MLSEQLARQFAGAQAKRTREERFVVLSRDEMDIPGNDWHIATAIDLETFFLGCKIIAVYGPSGEEAPAWIS